ncbi:MAG: hypothetical protein HYU29_05985 [Chloroflexi bacterium]|nr:hypothetical protein [Chloroflexota bacterium]
MALTVFAKVRWLLGALWPVLLLLVALGCQSPQATSTISSVQPTATATAPSAGTSAATPTPGEQTAYPGSKLEFDKYRGPLGTTIAVTGSGFPGNQEVALAWQTFDGSWLFEEENLMLAGPRYKARFLDLPKVRSDASGAFRTTFTVPEDFGGWHDIVARVDGKYATKNAFNITATFSVSPRSGPVGTPLTIRVTGQGRFLPELYHVSWDNSYTGYIMGVSTKGSSTSQLRISGGSGPHVLKIWRGFLSVPFLNSHQGPFGPIPEPNTFTINVTEGVYQAPSIWADPKPEEVLPPAPAAKSSGGARLSLSPEKGIVGSRFTVQGDGFPPGQPVQLTWATRTGRQVTPRGIFEGQEEAVRDLPPATADASGRFSAEVTVPQDFGGSHRINAVSGDKKAEGYYFIYASVVEFTERVRAGEKISIRVKGQGWTIQDKAYAVVYDNALVGFVCGFSASGYVDLLLPATGGPGPHTIDMYPTVYGGTDPTPDIYLLPDLNNRDHPGGVQPVFRLTVTITE